MPIQFWTFTGQCVNLLDPDPATINITDIAWSLSHICRFNGHTNRFYSVAQHSVLVSRWLQENGEGRKWPTDVTELGRMMIYWRGLMHDAAEAYIGDSVSLIKRNRAWLTTEYHSIGQIVEIEHAARRLMWETNVEAHILKAIYAACAPAWFENAYQLDEFDDKWVDELIHRADQTVTHDELIQLMGYGNCRMPMTDFKIKSWKPRKAYREFMSEFKKHVVREQ